MTTIALPEAFVVMVVEKTLLYNPVLVLESDGILHYAYSGAKMARIDYTLTPSKRATSEPI